jgi:hypothetical protein
MAVTVTDNRTIYHNEADVDSGYTSSSGKTQLYTADPPPVELTGSIGHTVSNTTEDMYAAPGGTVDLTSGLVYVWTLANGIMDTTQNGGITLVLGDGTNRIGYHLAGSDSAAFRYDGISVSWQCLLVDTSLLPTTYFTAYAGSEASLALNSISQIGVGHKTLAKAVGGVENCFLDIIRYSASKGYNQSALEITGGTTGDRGNFNDIYLYDRSNASQRALGVVRELASGVYGIQGMLSFGTSGTGDSWFHDIGSTVIFEDRFVDDDVYKLRVIKNLGDDFYFNGYNVGTAWPTDPGNMVDGSTASIAQANAANYTQLNNTNNSSGSGTIYKVEIRAYARRGGTPTEFYLMPVFSGTTSGAKYDLIPSTNNSIGWSDYFDITNDSSAPSTWSWTDIANLDCRITFKNNASDGPNDFVQCAQIDIRVVSGNTHFILDGVSIQSARPGVLIDFSDLSNLDELYILSCQFKGITQGIFFPTNDDSSNHSLLNSIFSGCGAVWPGSVPTQGCTFSEVSSAVGVSGGYLPALVWNQNIAISGSQFINNDISPSACGILHPQDGEYDYYDLVFDGNSYDIIFLGTGNLIINNIGTSDTQTYAAPNGGTVTINQAVQWTFSGIVSGSELRIQQARGANPSGAELYHVETTDGNNVTWTYNYSDYGVGYTVDVIVHNVFYEHLRIDNVVLPANDSILPIQQELDRWYSNP